MGAQSLDLNLFARKVTQWRLIDSLRNVLWNNRTPLKIEFVKESKGCILKEN